MIERAKELARDPVRWVPWVLAAVPALWMADFVRRGPHLQYADYWIMLPRFLTPSGGLDVDGLVEIHNGHPVAVAQLLYWINIRLFDGSNISLGLVVVLVVAAQVILISRFVEPPRRREWAAASVVVVASALLFSQQGVHNFTKSMSGTAWLTANLFVVAAVLSRWKDRTWLSIALGALASVSYGTGLVVWPVLVVVGMARDRRWLPDWRVVVSGVAVVGVFLAVRPEGDTSPFSGVVDLVESALLMGGAIFTDDAGVAKVLTIVGGLAALALTVVAVKDDVEEATPWLGLVTYGGLSLLLIAYSREPFIEAFGVQSRYASLAAFFWIGLFGLAGSVLEWRRILLAPGALLVVAAFGISRPAVEAERDGWPVQDDLAAALRLGLEGDVAYNVPFMGNLVVGPLLESSGHYPFSDLWDADCIPLGTAVDAASVTESPTGAIDSARLTTGAEGIRAIATLPDDTPSSIDCVVVTDDDGVVVGVGTVGVGQPNTFASMTAASARDDQLVAIAPQGSERYEVLLVLEDGTRLRLGEPIEADDLTGP